MEDFDKMKVADLKKELKNVGLSVEGKKSELVTRLHDHHKKTETQLLDHSTTEDVDDTSLEALEKNVLGEEPTSNSPAVSTKPVPASVPASIPQVDITKPAGQNEPAADSQPSEESSTHVTGKISLKEISGPSTEEKKPRVVSTPGVEAKLTRAKKFGLPTSTALSDKDKKELRAARFGGGTGSTGSASIKASTLSTDPDSLKKRAERFGIGVNELTTGTASATEEASDKLKTRQERFGVVSVGGAGGDSAKKGSSTIHITSPEEKDKMLKRKERFGPATTEAESEEKKMKRAARFEKTTS